MADNRNEVESGIEDLLAPLKTAKKLRTVMAIGGQDYGAVLESALGFPPFAIIKYTGKNGTLSGGGLKSVSAEISLLIGAKSYLSIKAQKDTIFDLLAEIEDALDGKRLGDAYYPLVMVREQWTEMTGGNLEVWEQAYSIGWEELTAV